jgi:hypothetical protein
MEKHLKQKILDFTLLCRFKIIQSWFFSKERLPINFNFKMNNMELEIVSEFIHLGTMSSK